MSILNNKISVYSNRCMDDLCNIVDLLFFDDAVFLTDKFYQTFKDNFNCNYDDFINYIEVNKIYTCVDLINEFFYYSSKDIWVTL